MSYKLYTFARTGTKSTKKKLGSYVLRFDQYWTSRRWRSNLVADPAVGILDAARPCCMNATVICCYLLGTGRLTQATHRRLAGPSPSVPHAGRKSGRWGPRGWPTGAPERRAAPPPVAALCAGQAGRAIGVTHGRAVHRGGASTQGESRRLMARMHRCCRRW